MKNIILLFMFAACGYSAIAQHTGSITIIDFVKIKDNKAKEAFYFYENNWKVYRDIALANGFIKGYKLLTAKADSTANFDIMLVTEYADSTQQNAAEARFNEIIKQQRPNGPKLLNELKPNEFRQNLFSKRAEALYENDKNN